VNVSDIAAMGGLPVAAFINLTVSSTDDAEWILSLYEGFEDAAGNDGFTIAGGDISRTENASGTVIGVTVVGHAPHPVLRSGARAGDVLIVSGPLGESAAGLWLLQNPDVELEEAMQAHLLARHHEPTARVAAMQAALGVVDAVHAALDLSDGLAGDAAHMARASGVALEIDVKALPVSPSLMEAARIASSGTALKRARDWALYGGEDYELLLAVAPENGEAVCSAMRMSGASPTIIGVCSENSQGGICLREGSKKMRPTRKAWTHF
jgi:thiamine-monophosphate kinase